MSVIRVLLDGFLSYLAGRSLGWVWLQQGGDELLRILANIFPVPLVEDNTSILALFNKVREVLRSEWRVSAKQGIGDDAHRPHVYWLAVPLLQHDFWCSISKRTGHGGEDLVLGIQHLGNAEICENKRGVGFLREVEEVFWLEI